MNNAGLYQAIRSIAEAQDLPSKPISLDVVMVKLKDRLNKAGNQKRYFEVYLGKHNVTDIVAAIAQKKVSLAKDTYGTICMRGSGMDMAFALTDRIARFAAQDGCDIFNHEYNHAYLSRQEYKESVDNG